jgi:hypothetical protein
MTNFAGRLIRKEIRVVFLDISKAFDRVWHKGLLFKLKKCGITGKLLDWLKDYLTDRQQRVIVNGEFSEWGKIQAGVPQGSVLGPLLFLIFINDITYVIKHCKIRLFADDTCLFIEVDDPDIQANQINEDLENLNQWANKWHVDFSPPKTEEVIISRKINTLNHAPSYLDGEPIKKVNHHKHLGLIVSQDLTWNEHIIEISAKANKRLGVLRSLKHKLDRHSLEKIYLGFIRPILEYGDVIWDTPTDILKPLEAIQRNAARVVTGATAKCSTEGLYKETAWEPLAQRREAHRASLMYKIINGKAPSYLTDLAPGPVGGRTAYMLRNRGDLDPPLARLNVYANSFFPKASRDWNNLSKVQRQAPSVEAFKAYHIRKLPPKNVMYYYGSRAENIIHARMRIENSPLKADLCDILHVIDSPLCPCGAGVDEDAQHFFFDCPLYSVQREVLENELLPYVLTDIDKLLFGLPDEDHLTNIHIYSAVHKYIKTSNRF